MYRMKTVYLDAGDATIFDQINAIIAGDVLMLYPNQNILFEIYTDANDYPLDNCIMQKGRPMAYYSQILNPAQKKITLQWRKNS